MKTKLMITGSFPPDICGVGDYVSCFISTQSAKDWALYVSDDWSLKLLLKKIREINAFHIDSIFLQYPTQGYGWSLLPQILCIYYVLFTRKKFVVVLHEFSQRSLKAKMATFFLFFANKIVFTNDFEKEYAKTFFPFIHKRFLVIKILSNIKSASILSNWSERSYDLIYFGHIRPNKGLEDVLETTELIQKKRRLKVAVVGQVLSDFQLYFDDLQRKYSLNKIDYYLNKDSDVVSSLLNNSKLVFLPFPDGISERRGSFLAAIANGALVVTYSGRFTTSSLKRICYLTSLKSAATDIDQLLCTINNDIYKERLMLQEKYLLEELPQSWDDIVQLYNNILV